jgi:osmotically inducible protein OsmC
MPVRISEAEWHGDLRGGRGQMRFGGGAFEGAYSFTSRFEEGTGTNPEELIAAAHAGCFSMFLADLLAMAGFPPERVQTQSRVHLDRIDGGFGITKIELLTEARVANADEATFQRLVQEAKANCPVSRALAAVPEITVAARLMQ